MHIDLRNHPAVRQFLAECLGTFILLTLAIGAVAQRVLGGPEAASASTVYWATGIGVILGIYASGGVSGGHINPAVTLAMAALGRLSWKRVPVYMLGQYLGSFLASAIVFLVYKDALDHYDGGERRVEGVNATAGIFATYPQPYVTTWTTFGDQVFATCFLLITILAILDKRNVGAQPGVMAVSMGLIVTATNMTLGLNCGNGMNPARDLSPRIFTAVAGWGVAPFRNYNWFWVPVVGPYIGGVLGALVYQGFVGHHWPHEPEEEKRQEKMLDDMPKLDIVVHSRTKL